MFGPGAGAAIGAVQAVANVVDQFVETADEKRAWEQAKARMMLEPMKAQTEINKIEAQHRSLFVAGWRPFIGWVCGVALVWHFILFDLLSWIVIAAGGQDLPPRLTGTGELITVLMSLLGLGALRTAEKIQGRSR